MTREEAIVDIRDNIKPVVGGKSLDMAIEALEQETVSRESYEHEYFLRKEFEIKIARLEQQEPILDKIRDEIEELKPNNPNFKGYFEQNVALNKALDIIDKYRGE